MKKKELIRDFISQFETYNKLNELDLELKLDYGLNNESKADFCILKGDQCLAIGNAIEHKMVKNEEDIRRYFFGKEHRFIGCGSTSNYWLFYDGKTVVLNDHKYIFPYDEYCDDFAKSMNRVASNKEKFE